ncbi:MAG TPA: hypothetical protein H9780_10445 [Candidatus Mediterraneibacter merdavium]|nr:hypothetical protein [Candidatus Mediterraneibacter merdavium]
MSAEKRYFVRRCAMMLIGILFICICVGCYRLSGFGVDAFTCMNLGVSAFVGMSFGTWQLIVNAVILVIVFFTVRKCIGAGTIVNMVCVGYGADLICWLTLDVFQIEMTLPLRIAALLAGCVFAGLGVAFYMVAEMGIAPYDSVALIIEKATKKKIRFQYARVISDVTCVVIGVVFCLIAGGSLWMIVGIGTLCNAFFNGPLIQFFKEHVSGPLLEKGRVKDVK